MPEAEEPTSEAPIAISCQFFLPTYPLMAAVSSQCFANIILNYVGQICRKFILVVAPPLLKCGCTLRLIKYFLHIRSSLV